MTENQDPNAPAESRDSNAPSEGLSDAVVAGGQEPPVAAQIHVPVGAAESQGPDEVTKAHEPDGVARGQEFSFALGGDAAAQEAGRAAEGRGPNGQAGEPVAAAPAVEPAHAKEPVAPPVVSARASEAQDAVRVSGAHARAAEGQDSNTRIRFGIKRKSDAALVDEPKVIEEHFPYNQTILWQPVTQGGPKGGNGKTDAPPPVAVVVTQEVLVRVNQHVSQTLEHEVGGFLIGDHCRCPETNREFVIIDQFSPAKFTEATEVSLAFTVDAWAHLNAELKGKFRNKLYVGWYHSHPRMDVFLSRYDMEIQNERFSQPWMTALVLEPEKHRGGFFCWRGGSVNPNDPVEFYELLERDSRESVVAWTNYVGIDTVTHQPPARKKTNTMTASSKEVAETPQSSRPFAPAVVVQGAPASDDMRKHSNSKYLFIAIIAAALLLGFASVWAIVKMRGGSEEKSVNAAAPRDTPAQTAQTSATSETAAAPEDGVEDVPPISIASMDTYGLVPGKDDVLGVGMVVDNVPEKFSVELGGHQAIIARNKKLPGAGNKREIYATVNFASEIDRMRKRPEDSLDLLVKVFDQEDSENYETQQFPIEPKKLGLDTEKPAPKGPVKIDKGKVTVVDKKTALLRRRAAAAAVAGRKDNKGHATPAAHEATTATQQDTHNDPREEQTTPSKTPDSGTTKKKKCSPAEKIADKVLGRNKC